jgi:uncharacterized protein with NRDE domain
VCLILLAWRRHPDYPLIVAANRDEYHARPAAPAAFWNDEPRILAGRDLEALGTWMGVSREGRFAAVTNYRGAREPRAAESRGALVARFLTNGESPQSYVGNLARSRNTYSGFNLLACDEGELWWYSNRDTAPRRLEAGTYGLGNFLLDSEDILESRNRFEAQIAAGVAVEPLFAVLAPSRIVAPEYGTRCSTVLIKDGDGRTQLAERTYDAGGTECETVRFEFQARHSPE